MSGTAPVIYEHGSLRVVAPIKTAGGRTVAAVQIEDSARFFTLVQSFDVDQIDGLAAALLRARELLRAEAAGQ